MPYRDGDASEITDLPEDNFGVHVENDMDERRLLWLVNAIGERKLRASVEKYRQRYPESLPFVSRLLKDYKLAVPPGIYAPREIPIYRVYVLLAKCEPVIKIGMSGHWLQRARNSAYRQSLEDFFDLQRSVGVTYYGDKRGALEVEKAAKDRFVHMRRPVPRGVPYGAGGLKEWFCGDVYKEVVEFIRSYASAAPRQYVTLATLVAACHAETLRAGANQLS